MAGLCHACSEPGQPSPVPQGQSPTHGSGTGGHIPAKLVGDSHLSIRAPFFGSPETHCTGISRCCPSTRALPGTTAFEHPSAMALGWHTKKQGQAPCVTPGSIPSCPSSAQHFPPRGLTAEPQFRVICIHSAEQTFVLQTKPAKPALDLYFSVCVWTPSPCRWKLMSSLSPRIRSEQRNCTAIWSSSALCSPSKSSLLPRIKL